MYKLVKRYFGELCDKEKTDEEVFDEEICFEHKNYAFVEKAYQDNLVKDEKDGYVIDDETKGAEKLGDLVRLFFGNQENWNNYIEMFIIKTKDEQDDLDREIDSIVRHYDKLTDREVREILLELEDKYEVHYQKIKNAVAERVIRKRLMEFKGSRTINNNTFISYVRDLEKEFECEIDLIDLSVRFIYQ